MSHFFIMYLSYNNHLKSDKLDFEPINNLEKAVVKTKREIEIDQHQPYLGSARGKKKKNTVTRLLQARKSHKAKADVRIL